MIRLIWGENEDRRAPEAKAATDTVFLQASGPVSNRTICSESNNFTGNDGHYPFITVYRGSNDSDAAVIRLLFLGSHYSFTPRSNLAFPITLMCMFWSVGGNYSTWRRTSRRRDKNVKLEPFKGHFSAEVYHYSS